LVFYSSVINNSILSNSLQRLSYCEIYMGQSEIVKVGKSFFFSHKIQQSGTVLRMPSSALIGMRAGGPRKQGFSCPTHEAHTSLLVVYRAGFFFKVLVVSLPPPPCHSAPYTLYFIHHFIHPSKEALLWYKETS